MKSLADLTETSKITQQKLLAKFNEVVSSKNKDLKDLKEENDLSEQGIYKAPKAFKSISEENNALEAVKTELDNSIETNNKRIKELEALYAERSKTPSLQNDVVNLYYQKALNSLKAEQLKAIQTRTQLTATLKQINEATEFERRRRIKRAAYTNEEDRYMQDRSTLKLIKQNTAVSQVPLKAADFDFGEEQSSNIQILKNIKNVESGFYVVVAVHNDVAKRDAFLTNAVAAGQSNIDFFYDVNTSKYFIYYQKLGSIEDANEVMKTKGSQPYNGKLSIIKIEN
jgi:DNA-binding transcriptional regulator YbjK